MYSMKDVCQKTGMNYETLKFYCNEGLVPNVKRDSRNYRIFTEQDIQWLCGLNCLRNCGLGIAELKEYTALCLQGECSIPQRKEILAAKRARLLETIASLQASIDYIDKKQAFYDDVLAGKTAYFSNILPQK